MYRALALILLSLLIPPLAEAGPLRSGEKVPVGTDDGRGPLAAYGVVSQPLGSAILSHKNEADLFIRTTKFGEKTGLFLYPFSDRNEEGIPVFGKGIEIQYPFEGYFPPSGDIFQTADGVVHGCWVQGSVIVHTVYSPKEQTFEERNRVTIEGLPRSARNLTLFQTSDGSWRVVLDVADGSPYRPPGPGGRDPEYNPYDGRGIWRGDLPYGGLYGAILSQDFSTLVDSAQLVSSTTREVMDSFSHLTSGTLKKDGRKTVIGGSRMGEITTYSPSVEDPKKLAEKKYIVGKDGNALRHPTILPSPVVYPNPESGITDLMVGGEGGIYFYRFTGLRSETGNLVFENPVPALQENADLYAGSLPVPNLVDWDNDKDLDIITGNSEGLVLFFENAGSNETPKYLNSVPIKAGGHTIHVQPGYRLDIQGPFESRWGYTCPAVADWNEDGLPDILMSDSTARHHLYLNIGSQSKPELAPAHPIYLDGLELHGTWRVKPGVARMGERMAYVNLDDDDHFHLYWRIDDYHLEDGGKLRLEDGSVISANFLSAGGSGRSKLNLHDWDMDGNVDLIVGTPKHGSVPNSETGLPQSRGRLGSSVLFLKNVGSNESPRFRFPVIFRFKGEDLYIGHHSCGPAVAVFRTSGEADLVVSNEDGRLLFFSREDLSW